MAVGHSTTGGLVASMCGCCDPNPPLSERQVGFVHRLVASSSVFYSTVSSFATSRVVLQPRYRVQVCTIPSCSPTVLLLWLAEYVQVIRFQAGALVASGTMTPDISRNRSLMVARSMPGTAWENVFLRIARRPQNRSTTHIIEPAVSYVPPLIPRHHLPNQPPALLVFQSIAPSSDFLPSAHLHCSPLPSCPSASRPSTGYDRIC